MAADQQLVQAITVAVAAQLSPILETISSSTGEIVQQLAQADIQPGETNATSASRESRNSGVRHGLAIAARLIKDSACPSFVHPLQWEEISEHLASVVSSHAEDYGRKEQDRS